MQRKVKLRQLSAAEARKAVTLGPQVLIGGRFESDNIALSAALAKRCNGRMQVFGTASMDPRDVGEDIVRDFRRDGVDAEYMALTAENRQSAFDERFVERIDRSGGAYFSGGDQLRIVRALIQDRKETPVLQALRRLQERGGLICGSSAGAAMQSDPMMLGGSSLEALTIGEIDDPDEPGISLRQGLGFFRWGLVDQHFIERGRIGRLVAALRCSGQRWGFGVDENTGMISEGNTLKALGETGFVMVDMATAQHAPDGSGTTGIRLSYVDSGDRINLRTGRLTPARAKKPFDAGSGGFSGPARHPRDGFGSYAFHELWERLAEGDQSRYHQQEILAGEPRYDVAVRMVLTRDKEKSRVFRDRNGRMSMADFFLSFELIGRERDRLRAMAHWAKKSVQSEKTISPKKRKSRPVSPVASSLPGMHSGRIRMFGREFPLASPKNKSTLIANFGSKPANPPRNLIDCGGRGRRASDQSLKKLEKAKFIHLATGDRRHMLAQVTSMGENSKISDLFSRSLPDGASILARGEAVPALGEQVISYGDARSAIRWGVSSDAGVEGMVLAEGFGLVPGIIDTGIDRPGHLGRLIIACAERRMIGWGLPDNGGIEFEPAVQRITNLGDMPALLISVDPRKRHSTRKRLDIRDAMITPVSGDAEALVELELAAKSESNDKKEQERIVSLIEAFAQEIDARQERGSGKSWIGEELLMRVHIRVGGTVSLDISCHRDRLSANIR